MCISNHSRVQQFLLFFPVFAQGDRQKANTYARMNVCVCVCKKERRADQSRPDQNQTRQKIKETPKRFLCLSLCCLSSSSISCSPPSQFLLRLLPCDVLQLWLLRGSLKFASDCIGVPASVYGSEIAARSPSIPPQSH